MDFIYFFITENKQQSNHYAQLFVFLLGQINKYTIMFIKVHLCFFAILNMFSIIKKLKKKNVDIINFSNLLNKCVCLLPRQ